MAIKWDKFRQIAKAVARAERGDEYVPALVQEPKRINVCEQIKCPCAYRTSLRASSGCSKYSSASQCHLLRDRPALRKEVTPYFINSDPDSVNIAELKIENDKFFLDDPQNKEWLEIQVECGDRILYAPFSEETFDLAAYLEQSNK